MTPSLRPYQRAAVDHLLRNPRAGLFLDMGLGKTATTLSALTPDHLPALVVAPKRVAENVWPEEQRIWRRDLRLVVAAGPPARRREALASAKRGASDIVVISRDNFRDAEPVAPYFKTLIIDESSSFKSIQSERFKAARRMTREHLPHVWELTGTPSPNGYLDLWAQLYLLDKGQRLYSTITKYRQRYFIAKPPLPNGIIPGWVIRPGAADRINRLIEDICLSMTTEGRIDLPEMTLNEVSVGLPAAARAVYRKLSKDFIADLDLLGGEVHTAANAAVLSGKLSQLSAGFMYVDDADLRGGAYDIVHREKIAALREIIEGTGSPVLVFYRFKAEREMILAAFKGNVDVHTIDEPDWYERWNRGEIPVLLAHPTSIGHGLNLQKGGHTAVWTTPDWDSEPWDQGNKRLHRSGQQHPVMIHVLLASKMDQTILARLRDKTTVQEALMKYLESPL